MHQFDHKMFQFCFAGVVLFWRVNYLMYFAGVWTLQHDIYIAIRNIKNILGIPQHVLQLTHPAEEEDQSLDKEPGIKVFFNSFLNIFPVPDLGMKSTNMTRLIFLYGATCNNWIYALFIWSKNKYIHTNHKNENCISTNRKGRKNFFETTMQLFQTYDKQIQNTCLISHTSDFNISL